MPIDQKILEQFMLAAVKKNAPLLQNVKSQLGQYYRYAGNGNYDLSYVRNANQNELAKAIALATGTTVDAIIPFQLSRTNLAPELTTPEQYKLANGLKIGDGLMDLLYGRHQYHLSALVPKGFGRTFQKDLEVALRQSLMDALEPVFWKRLDVPLWRRHRIAVWDALFYSLVYFIGFTLLNRKNRADSLEPLVRLQLKHLPVCARHAVAGSWIVIGE